jgi:hypothetical protein
LMALFDPPRLRDLVIGSLPSHEQNFRTLMQHRRYRERN